MSQLPAIPSLKQRPNFIQHQKYLNLMNNQAQGGILSDLEKKFVNNHVKVMMHPEDIKETEAAIDAIRGKKDIAKAQKTIQSVLEAYAPQQQYATNKTAIKTMENLIAQNDQKGYNK